MITIEDVDEFLQEIQRKEMSMAKGYNYLAKEVKDFKLKNQFLHMEQEEYVHLQTLKDLMLLLVENWRKYKNDN